MHPSSSSSSSSSSLKKDTPLLPSSSSSFSLATSSTLPITLLSTLSKKTASFFLPSLSRSNSSRTTSVSIHSTSPSSHLYHPKKKEDPPPFKSTLLNHPSFTSISQQHHGKEAFSCLACHAPFMVLGTQFGHIHVLELSTWRIMNSWTCHASSVTDIRIDSTGKWFASVSLDGKLAMGLLSTSHTLPQIYEFHRPIKCVQFDPEFSKTKRLVIGGHAGEVVCIDLKQPNLPKKITWVKNLGYIVALHWALPNILLYATEESAVEVYDIKNQIVLHRCIIPTMTVEVHAYRCFFFWKDPETLALAWNQTFQIILFKFQSMFENATKPQIFVHRNTNFITAGLHPFGDVYLIFALPPSETAEDCSEPVVLPSIVIFDPFLQDPILSKTPFQPSSLGENTSLLPFPTLDSQLVSYDTYFFVTTQKQLWWIQSMTLNDLIEWYLQQGYYERALKTSFKATSASPLSSTPSSSLLKDDYRLYNLGPKILSTLLTQQIEVAASLTPYVLDTSALWEKWIPIFAENHGLDYLLKYVPTDPPMDACSYEYILNHYLQKDIPTFRSLVLSWPSQLFRYEKIITMVESKLNLTPNDPLLNNVAIHLYQIQGLPQKEFVCHLKLKDFQSCLELLKRNPETFPSVLDTFAMDWFQFCLEVAENNLMKMIHSEGIQLLLKNTSELKPEFVLSLVKGEKKFQLVYLSALFQSNSTHTWYHPLLLELLVEYQPEQLYSFLTQSIHYSLDRALELCIAKDLVLEQVYVLSRIGQKHKALSLLLDRCHDIEKAIQFVQQEDDMELWDALVIYAQHHPTAWAPLFACHQLDPVFLLQRVPKGTSIPGFQAILITLVHRYEVQLQFRQQCHLLQTREHICSIDTKCNQAKRGLAISLLQSCHHCEQPFIVSKNNSIVSTIKNGKLFFRHQSCPTSSKS